MDDKKKEDVIPLSELSAKRKEVALSSSRFRSLDSLSREQRQVDWLVKDVIESGTHGMLFGPPESGKTLVLFDLAYCIASGKKWRNRRVKQSAVFYVCGEGHGGLGRRAKAWRKHNEIPDGDDFPIFYSVNPAELINEEDAERISDEIMGLCEAYNALLGLIAIDTLARNFGGGDENSSTDMGRVISNIDNYFIKRTGAAILTSHHTGLGSQERARGSSALLGALDVCYRVEKDSNSMIEMSCTKSKDFNRPDPFTFRLRVHELGYQDEDGVEITGATVESIAYAPIDVGPKLKGYKLACYEMLCDMYTRQHAQGRMRGLGADNRPEINVDDLKQAIIKLKLGPEANNGMPNWRRVQQGFSKALNELIDEGLVTRRNDQRLVYPTKHESD